jgi:hypothetical protein
MKLKVKHFPVEDCRSFALLVTVYFNCASEILLVLGTSAVYWVDLLKVACNERTAQLTSEK